MTNTHEKQDPQGFYQSAIIIKLDCVIYLEDKMGVECLRVIAFAAHTACNGRQAERGRHLLGFIGSVCRWNTGTCPLVAPLARLHKLLPLMLKISSFQEAEKA